MVRSFFAFAALLTLVTGCSPDAAKSVTDKAADNVKSAAKGAADSVGAGMSEMMGKANEALSGVEGGSEMLKQVTELFGKATKTLNGIKDVDSAKSALPDLSQLTESFNGISDLYGKLPDAAKSAVAGVFQSSLGNLKPVIEKVMAIPGVGEILKPAIDALMSKLEAFKA